MKYNDVLLALDRPARREALAKEARARKTGQWGEWERVTFPAGSAGGTGWPSQVTTIYRNRCFSVMVRDAGQGVVHYAISSLSQVRPSWHEMQRIKDELAGEDLTAVEVYPPRSEIVDGAHMFHFWVLPGPLAFGLYDRERAALDGDSTHDWFVAPGLKFESCRHCGIVRRADRRNTPCRGPVAVGPRAALNIQNREEEK